jgi:hypothetical protein
VGVTADEFYQKGLGVAALLKKLEKLPSRGERSPVIQERLLA